MDDLRPPRRAARALAAAVLLWTAAAHARPLAEPDTPADPPDTLDFQPVRDGILVGLGAAFWLVEETALKDELAPDQCRWCDADGGGDDGLNRLDASLRDLARWDDPSAADDASNVSAYLVSPIVALGMGALAAGREGRLHDWREDTLVVVEAAVIATVIGKLSKVAFARQRPYAHFRTDETEPADPDENESFISGHATLAFSLAVAGGTVASVRGYETAPWVWSIGLTTAAAAAYFRVAADEHYVTDVLAGAAVGSAIGFAVPWFLNRRDLPREEPRPPGPAPTVVLLDGGAVLGARLAW